MYRLKKSKRLWLALSIFSIVSLPVSLFGIVFFAWRIKYVWLIVSLLLFAHSAYGIPFYLRAHSRAGIYIGICNATHRGLRTSSQISEFLGMREEYILPYIAKCMRLGYISVDDLDTEVDLT